MMINQFWAYVLGFVCVVLSPGPLRADLILDVIGDLQWDRTASPQGPAVVNFSVHADNNPPAINQLNAFSVGVRVLPTAGAIGSLEILSVSIPDNKPMFNTYATNDLPLVKQADIQTISGENGPLANVTVPESGRNLFMAQFYSPDNNAVGKFDIYLDRDTTNYFTTTAFDGFKFFNVPAVGDPKGVLIGSFNVNVTAVPEPSTLLLTAIATAGVAIRSRRGANAFQERLRTVQRA